MCRKIKFCSLELSGIFFANIFNLQLVDFHGCRTCGYRGLTVIGNTGGVVLEKSGRVQFGLSCIEIGHPSEDFQ